MLHMLQVDVANVSFVFSLMLQQVFLCCKLQVFHVDVTYVADLQWLYTYVASVLFQMFQMLQTYVARVLYGCCICFTHMFGSVSSGCCICFTHMLQVFYLDVVYVLQWLHMRFPGVSYVCCKCFN
jgi:hypothetical protein